eukprot:TRINITY_DN30684_c0_g1_i1.p1 TRINITY_DN30684_c0_g1~~TRINITY_DN30684_c0_g1_i1.p1  ORF type:complete len:409 (-),score=71.85 TRINITY_DN30684_c0_g1_i1:924-2150(-)
MDFLSSVESDVPDPTAFLSSRDCFSEINSSLNACASSIEELCQISQQTSSCMKSFGARANTQMNAFTKLRSTLKSQNQLLELLEIPQLMETYIRNRMFDEATDLAVYTRRLPSLVASSFSMTQNGIVASIVDEVSDSAQTLANMLVNELCDCQDMGIQLKLIDLLRQLFIDGAVPMKENITVDDELRMLYLTAQSSLFKKAINKISTQEPVNYLMETLDTYMKHIDLVLNGHNLISNEHDSKTIHYFVLRHSFVQFESLLHLWKVQLSNITECRKLRKLVVHIEYLSKRKSLLWQGISLEEVLLPLIKSQLVRILSSRWEESVTSLKLALVDSSNGSVTNAINGVINSIIGTLNELRECTLSSAYIPLRIALEDQIGKISEALPPSSGFEGVADKHLLLCLDHVFECN